MTSPAAQEQARPITLAEAKALLVSEQEAREELTYEQKLALDHADHFVTISADDTRKIADRVLEIGGRITPYYAFRVADLLPTHEDDVKAIFAKERSAPTPEVIEKILAIVVEYL